MNTDMTMKTFTEQYSWQFSKTIQGSGRTVEHRTVSRGDSGSIPPTAVSERRLSEETFKACGPFYLVSKSGEVKDRTQGVNV